MNHICLHDRQEIYNWLHRDALLNVYSIADLDDFFWPWTSWYGLPGRGGLAAVALLYSGMELPTLLALTRDDPPQVAAMGELLEGVGHLLPRRFAAHLGPGLMAVLQNEGWSVEYLGRHLKMGLTNPAAARSVNPGDVARLGPDDLPDLLALYRRSYPGNWFDPRMLETGEYFGLRELPADANSLLVCVAGVHAVSRRYGVAALGNITTAEDHRSRGYAQRVTAALCQSLLNEGLEVGLNVHSDNAAAIAAYRRIGFEVVAVYDEMTVSSVPA